MAIVKCRECDRDISTSAACPGCGAKPKKQVNKTTIVVVALFGLAFLHSIATRETPPAPPPLTPEQAAARDRDLARSRTGKVAIAALKASLKDPDSLKVVSLGVSKDGNTACVFYRARNSFNAVVPGAFVLDGQSASTEEASIKKKCRDLLDYTDEV